MSGTLIANWWTGLLVMIAITLLIVSFIMLLHECGICPLRDVSKTLHRPWFERLLLLLFVSGMVQYAATKGTGNGSRSSGPKTRNDTADEILMTALLSGNSQESGEVRNLCFTGIAVLTNGVELSIAWPTNLFVLGTTLDFFAKYHSLTNAWQWFAYAPTTPDMTNLTMVVNWQTDLGCESNPPAMFFKVQDRVTSAATMADADGDGLPDVYELNNGTNPYVSDYALASKLTVGEGGDYRTISAALAASTNYSIVELSSEVESLDQTVVLPSHPVLITGPREGYARLYSSADIAAFLLDAGQDSETLLRNFYIVLTARSNFQSAFWIGGNLPWSGVGASPTFENVRVRALYPNVLHYGWHYYRDDTACSSLSNCTMNAAGSTSAIGLYSYGGPSIVTSACAFVNFPTNVGSSATWMKAEMNIVTTLPTANTNFSWAGYALDQSYSSSADSDGDGLSDYAEIHDHDVDPWLPDSDGDGLTDAEEINAGTDPKDLYSFYRRVTVVTTTTDNFLNMTNYVACGTSAAGWETNGQSYCSTFPTTNIYDMISSNSPMYVKSVRDLNRNGRYDPEADIILIKQVPPLDAISTIVLQFGDVDNDGVADATERQDGTDPYDSGAFRMRANVSCTNTDVADCITNYLGMVGGAENERIAFIGSGTLAVNVLLTNGVCEVFCLRDFNGNGSYDAAVDVLYSRALTKSDNAQSISITIGDADSDGQSDSSEQSRGTNPADASNYCFNLALVEKGIFSTTNALTAEIIFGTNVVAGPIVMTNRIWEVDVGHLATSNHESVITYFWDDANSNGLRDAEECYARQTLTIKGHDNILTNTLSVGTFDHDSDGMLDYWELLHADASLSPTNAADAWSDFDEDGLENFYEYKLGLNPKTPDSTNLAIAITHSSVDCRTMRNGIEADRFQNYVANGNLGVFSQNTNCWAYGIDISCASMWHSSIEGSSDCAPTNTTVTAISSRYVIYANHYGYAMSTNLIYYFLGIDGNIYTNRLVSCESIAGDIAIGRLEHELPECVHPAKFLPDDYTVYLGNGYGIPVVTLDQSERFIVHDLQHFVDADNRSLRMYSTVSVNPHRAKFNKYFVSGDSSSPRFLIFGNEVIILGTLWYGGSGSCCHATLYKREIEAKMNGDKLTIFNLSQFGRIPNNEENCH